MSSAWGNAWGLSWGNSWGYVLDPETGVAERQFVPISFATAGVHEIAAGVQDVAVRVLAYNLVAAGTVTATFRSSTTPLTGPMTMIAGRQLASGLNRRPGRFRVAPKIPRDACLLQTEYGKALNLALSGAVVVAGFMVVQRLSRT